MKLESFGFRGDFVQTSPIVFQSSDQNLTLVASPYGNRDDLNNALDDFLAEFERISSDLDVTSPHPRLSCFNDHENLLYISLLHLNDYIYSTYNKDLINLGCDLFCCYKNESSLHFTQVGWPLVLMHQNNKTLPLCADYSFLPKDPTLSPYIPSSFFGIESSINLRVQTAVVDDSTELILLKSNQQPQKFIDLYPTNLKNIASIYAEQFPNQGFWLGKITL